LIVRIKELSKNISQRRLDGKQLDVFVYKYVSDIESAILIINNTMEMYREKLTIETDNHLFPNEFKEFRVVLGVGKHFILRMKKIDPMKSGDFKETYKAYFVN